MAGCGLVEKILTAGEPAEPPGRYPHQLELVVPERAHPTPTKKPMKTFLWRSRMKPTRHLVDRDRDMSRIDPRIGLAPILFGE